MQKKVFVGVIALVVFIVLIVVFYSITQTSPKPEEERTMSDFIKENLKQEYLPQNLIAINKLTNENTTDGMYNLWGSIWFVNNLKFYVDLHYNLNSSGISDQEILIFPDNMPNVEELNEDKATALSNSYFTYKSVSTEMSCKHPNNNVTYCEAFWTDNSQTKKGIVVVTSNENKFIAMCEFPLGSEEYIYNSCIRKVST